MIAIQRTKKWLAVAVCALALGACATEPPAGQSEGAAPGELTYGDVRLALSVILDSSSPVAGTRITPTAPPDRYSAAERLDYWRGMTSSAMRRCGYVERAADLRALKGESRAFDHGSLKLKGDQMVSCAEARRLADRLIAEGRAASGN